MNWETSIATAFQFTAQQDSPHFVSEEDQGICILRPDESGRFVIVAIVNDDVVNRV